MLNRIKELYQELRCASGRHNYYEEQEAVHHFSEDGKEWTIEYRPRTDGWVFGKCHDCSCAMSEPGAWWDFAYYPISNWLEDVWRGTHWHWFSLEKTTNNGGRPIRACTKCHWQRPGHKSRIRFKWPITIEDEY